MAKDLLDAYQSRLRELLDEAAEAAREGFGPRRAEAAAQAAGYWRVLETRYAQDRGATAAAAATADLRAARRRGGQGRSRRRGRRRAEIARALDGFTAAPFTPDEAARRAQQLLRFLALVPVEYDRGVDDTRVTLDFEIQEAVAFRTGAAAAFTDLEAALDRRDAAAAAAVEADLERLRALVGGAAERPTAVAPAAEVERVAGRAQARLDRLYPAAWKRSTDESDYDLIDLTLDRMEAAVAAGEYDTAEQARLEAYAFFEFGPGAPAQGLRPGARARRGGTRLVRRPRSSRPGRAHRRSGRPVARSRERASRSTRRSQDSAATLGDGASRATVVTNAAVLVSTPRPNLP